MTVSKRNKRNYDKEFKQQAVRLYFEKGKSYKQLSSELGVPEATLAGWVCIPIQIEQGFR